MTSSAKQPDARDSFACPCCRNWTLPASGAFELCPVCFWQDDGQGDGDAAEVRGGPNGSLSLSDARENYVALGACDRRHLSSVRSPEAQEVSFRTMRGIECAIALGLVGDDPPLHASIDALLSALLSVAPGFAMSRATDGVLLVRVDRTPRRLAASGLVVMVEDQCLQPFELQIDLDGQGACGGFVRIGDAGGQAVEVGSRLHRRLERELMSDEPREFAWMTEFERGDSWRCCSR